MKDGHKEIKVKKARYRPTVVSSLIGLSLPLLCPAGKSCLTTPPSCLYSTKYQHHHSPRPYPSSLIPPHPKQKRLEWAQDTVVLADTATPFRGDSATRTTTTTRQDHRILLTCTHHPLSRDSMMSGVLLLTAQHQLQHRHHTAQTPSRTLLTPSTTPLLYHPRRQQQTIKFPTTLNTHS